MAACSERYRARMSADIARGGPAMSGVSPAGIRASLPGRYLAGID